MCVFGFLFLLFFCFFSFPFRSRQGPVRAVRVAANQKERRNRETKRKKRRRRRRRRRLMCVVVQEEVPLQSYRSWPQSRTRAHTRTHTRQPSASSLPSTSAFLGCCFFLCVLSSPGFLSVYTDRASQTDPEEVLVVVVMAEEEEAEEEVEEEVDVCRGARGGAAAELPVLAAITYAHTSDRRPAREPHCRCRSGRSC